MTLPHSYELVLLLTILTMFCWGSWANSLKLVRGWRFELLYYDYAIGVALCAAVAGFTFGVFGSDGPGMVTNLAHASLGSILCGFAGGVVFNLSNILVIGAVSVAGMGVGFPIGVGLALAVGVIWNYFVNPQGNPWLLFGGVFLIVSAIVVDAIAYRAHAARGGATGPADAARKRSATWKAIRLSVAGGLMMGMFDPLVEIAKKGNVGLGPYAVGLVFGLGILVSVFVFNLYFMRFPIAGPRLSFRHYLGGTAWAHALGLGGGVMWMTGSLANFVAASAPRQLQVGPAISYAIGQGSTMVGALWGILVWKEFAGGGKGVNWLLAGMFVLFLGGLGAVSVAPLFAAH